MTFDHGVSYKYNYQKIIGFKGVETASSVFILIV